MILLNELHQEMRACQVCLEAGYQIVPGAVFSGVSAADVMLIGQAPGVTEVEAKRPFNASSGRRLFQWLEVAGWDEADFRTNQYMTAVTKCFPGKGRNGKGDRVPSKAEQKLCRPFLEHEIALVQPRVMILVGGLAIKRLFPAKLKLNELIGTAVYFPPATLTKSVNFEFSQGEWLRGFDAGKDKNGRWVVPLPHPSGASLWPNKPANKKLIADAVEILAALRQQITPSI